VVGGAADFLRVVYSEVGEVLDVVK